MKFFLHGKFRNIKSLMPSGNCVIYKKVHIGQRWLTLHIRTWMPSGEGVWGGERGPQVCWRGTSLWRIWHKQGPSSQTTCTLILDKTTKYVMKIIQFLLFAYLLRANQIIAWYFSNLNWNYQGYSSPCGSASVCGWGAKGHARTRDLLQCLPAGEPLGQTEQARIAWVAPRLLLNPASNVWTMSL